MTTPAAVRPGRASGLLWTAWPLRRRPAQGAMAAVIIVGTWWGVWSWTHDPWMVVLSVVVLSVTLASFFVPTTYCLSGEGVEIRRPWRTWRRPWQDFRGIRKGERLLVLSPFARRSWLDGIRGETLLLEDNGGEVLAYVEEMVGKETGAGLG